MFPKSMTEKVCQPRVYQCLLKSVLIFKGWYRKLLFLISNTFPSIPLHFLTMEFWINSLNVVLHIHQQLTLWLEKYSPSFQVKLILGNWNLQKEGATCKLAKVQNHKGPTICILSNFLNLRDPQSHVDHYWHYVFPVPFPSHSVCIDLG